MNGLRGASCAIRAIHDDEMQSDFHVGTPAVQRMPVGACLQVTGLGARLVNGAKVRPSLFNLHSVTSSPRHFATALSLNGGIVIPPTDKTGSLRSERRRDNQQWLLDWILENENHVPRPSRNFGGMLADPLVADWLKDALLDTKPRDLNKAVFVHDRTGEGPYSRQL